MAWTKEQQDAIESRGQSLLLAAAAGSGKTAVLVERIIRRLLDEQHPIDITELLVVTFTKAAATEMAQRVGAALTAALAKGENPAIERQLALLPAAHISTLHSFCQDVIRQYFYIIDLDPAFTIAGEEELNLLRHTVLEDLLLGYYEDEEKSKDLYPLADMFGNDRGDDMLMETVIRLYTFSRSMAWPDAWLDDALRAYTVTDDAVIDDQPWCGPLKDQLRRTLTEAARQYDRLRNIIDSQPSFSPVAPDIASEGLALREASTQESWHDLERFVQRIEFGRLKALRKLSTEEKDLWEQCKAIRNGVKKDVADSIQAVYFSATPEEWLDGMRRMAPVMQGLVTVTKDFAKAYRAAKKEKGWIDFNDLEHFCLQILLDPASTPDHPVPSAAAQELAGTFAEVLIDEYQDTNGVQELIMRLVSNDHNRFMVGDIKQSIYRFRLADPTLFLHKYTTFRRDEAATERCIDLSRNFRSAPNILAAVNDVFAQIMTKADAGMDYGSREMLYPGREMPDDARWVGGPIEAHLVLTDTADTDIDDGENLTAFEKECRFIASRIVRLKEEQPFVQRKDGSMEHLSYRHIVVLLRSMSGKADVLLEALSDAGIPAYAEQNGGYFAAVEVQIMLALLECIDNPEQDLPMAAVLRSPMVGMTEEALGALRLSGVDTLWQNLPVYMESLPDGTERQNVARFIEHLDQWRTFSRRQGVAELIQRIYHDTAYYTYVGGMPGGAVRQANLQALYERARQYEDAGFRGIFRYLQLIHKMQDEHLDLAPAKVLGEREDVVRIMSIHKSKGLEFPVVIMGDMTKSFNRKDMQSLVLTHNTLGIGLKEYDPAWQVLSPTGSWLGIAAQLRFESTAEEERVLYVGMTRARDKLILVGHSKYGQTDWERWCDGITPGQAKSYYDWVMPVACQAVDRDAMSAALQVRDDRQERGGLWEISIHSDTAPAAVTATTGEKDPRLEALRLGRPTGTAVPDWLDEALSFHYAYPKAVTTAAKFSVSEVKRQYQQQQDEETAQEQELAVPVIPETSDETDPFTQEPPWLTEKQPVLTGARRGTVMHKVMQYLTFSKAKTRHDVEQQLGQWEEQGLFTADEVQAVYVNGIVHFCQSPLGRRLAQATDIRREYPFTVLFTGGAYLPLVEEGERMLIQGVVDCLFYDGSVWVLVDYKTDRLASPDEFRDRYAIQLAMYKRAIEQISAITIHEVYIYSFHLEQSISFS